MDDKSQKFTEALERKLRAWQDRLLDLSYRNRLLNFRTSKSSTIEVIHPPLTELFERLVVKGNTLAFKLTDIADLVGQTQEPESVSTANPTYKANELGTKQSERQLARNLYNLRKRAKAAREEHGINILYMAMGFLIWKDAENADTLSSPLVLVPVGLNRPSLTKPYQLNAIDDDVFVNPTLRLKLRQDFHLELPDLSENVGLDGFAQYLEQVGSLVKPFPDWQVKHETVISIFGFQQQTIVADFQKHRRLFASHPLVRRLIDPSQPVLQPSRCILRKS